MAFGPFRVLHQVGAGTLGPVFRAHDPEGGRLVAIKAFRLDITPERAAQLATALQDLADLGLDHPSIASAIAAGADSSVAWLAQTYVPAESLDAALRQYGPPPPADALTLVTHLAGALDFAAASSVLHGSLHLRDVLVAPDETHLIDLGIAGALESCGLQAPVRPPWSAPERVAGGPATRAADVFALGIIAMELLTGERPAGSGPEAVAGMPDVPGANRGALADVFRTALDPDPTRRFKSALALAAALKLALGDMTGRPAPAAKRTRRTQGRDLMAPLPLEHDGTLVSEPDATPVASADAVRESGENGQASRAAEFELPIPTVAASPAVQRPASVEVSPRERERITRATHQPADVSRPRADRLRGAPTPSPDEGVAPAGGTGDDFDLHQPAEAGPAWDAPQEGAGFETSMAAAREAGPTDSVFPRADEERRTPWFALAAMLIVGLVAGFAAGYLTGVRRGAPSSDGSGAAAGAAVTPAPAAAEEARATEVQVPPEVVPEPAAPPPAATSPATPAPRDPTPRAPAPVARQAESPRPTPVPGRLVVRSTPQGARVEVNGTDRGTTPLTLTPLPLGSYTLRLSRDGYRAEQRRVTLSAGRASQTVAVPLRREQAAQTARAPAGAGTQTEGFAGSVMVESRPPGAQVFLDGRLVGTTPLLLSRVPAGSHVVRLEHQGHNRWTTEIRVVAGERQQVRASLEEAAR